VLPLGAFLFFHLGVNLRALSGDAAFAGIVDALHRSRGFAVAEAVVLGAPLLLHATLGLWLTWKGEPLARPSPYAPPLLAALRATGVVAAVFVVAHLFDVRFRIALPRPAGAELASLLAAEMSSTRFGIPWRAAAYVAAAGCVAFHFVVGCWGAYARSAHGMAGTRRRTAAAVVAAVVGVALGVGFGDVVVFHATGMRLLGGHAPGAAPVQACP
jgi:succinate dehydrogenase / fumarate reductase cytochrome b subunit